MDDLSHGIKTKSLTAALEVLTEQVSSLTTKDLQEQTGLMDNLEHLSDGIRKSSKQFCECLGRKFRLLNPALNPSELFQEMLKVSEEISTSCILLTYGDIELEAFQDKVACLLEAVLKLLVLWDQEIVIGLRKLINYLRNTLVQMRKSSTVQDLVIFYRQFVGQLIKFFSALYHRIADLVDQKMQSEFIIHLKCIQKLARSMAEIIKNVSYHPLSKHSKLSKEFITKEMLSLLDEIEDLLTVEEPIDKFHEGASFLTAIDEVLDKLDRGHFDDEELESRIEAILQHSMTVSKFSVEEDRDQITRASHRVLNEFRSLQNLLNNLEQSPGDISLAVDILRDFLELLEQAVNHSLLRMMIENFSTCTEPMRRLIERCPLSPGEVTASRSTVDLATDVEAFDTIMERVLQTCFFALASTEDILKMQIIRCALKLLESLEAEMIPAVYSCYQDPDDEAAACHLQFLWRSFLEQSEHVQVSLDSIADPIAFCHVSEKILTDHVYALRKHLYTQNSNLLESHTRPISIIVARCLTLLKKQNWDKGIHAKIHTKEIKYALKEYNGAALLTLENISDLRSHRSLLKRSELVLKYLMKGIDSLRKLQDSDLLSFTESFQGSRLDPPSIVMDFPESINDLPFDPMRTDNAHSTLSRSTLIGRHPSRKLQKTINYSRGNDNVREMERFVSIKKPWRTRTSTLTRSAKPIKNDVQPSRENLDFAASLDLTDILEELTALESTITRMETTTHNSELEEELSIIHHREGNSEGCASPESAEPSHVTTNGLSTPSRLRSLRIVSERLASFRKSLKES